MSANNDSLLEAYLFETGSLLEQLDNLVLAAEDKDSFSEDDINTIFRIMHTIKGSSAMMEYNSLMTIAHRVEDLFAIIRDTSIDIVPESHRPELFDLLFQSIDFFRQETEHLENGEPLTDNIDSLLQKINSFIEQIQGGGKDQPAAAENTPAPAAGGPTGVPGYPYLLQVFFDEGCGMENLRAFMLVNEIRSFCQEDDFKFRPEDVQTNPATSAKIAESGFLLCFRKQAERDSAIHSVTGSGFVRTYQTIDHTDEPAPAQQPEKPAAKIHHNIVIIAQVLSICQSFPV